jgi:hypothetical protein
MSTRIVLAGLLATILAGGACGSGSCVQFDGQSLLLHHDLGHDRLDLLLIYRDLHTTGDPAQGLEQLEAIRSGDQTFAVASNFPLLFDLDELAHDQRDRTRLAASAFLDAFVANTTVRNGDLWQDEAGRVCGSQLVRIATVNATLQALNATIHETLSRPGEVERFANDWHAGDPQTLERLREAARGSFTFAGLRGSAIWFALPISDAGFVAQKRMLVDTLERTLSGAAREATAASERAQAHAMLEALALNEWTIERSPGIVTYLLGAPYAETVEVVIPPVGRAAPGVPDVLARRALADALRPRGWKIGGAEGEAEARAAFEAFSREP